jgi:hypothetical protein
MQKASFQIILLKLATIFLKQNVKDKATYRMTIRGIKAVEFPATITEHPAEIIKKLCISGIYIVKK